MADGTIRVTNLRQFVAHCDAASAEVSSFMRDGLLAIAEDVAKEIRPRYAQKSAKGAAGVKAKVSKAGIAIDSQTLRKSRGLRQRRNFGPLMFSTAFLPGLKAGEPKAQAAVDALMTTIQKGWED